MTVMYNGIEVTEMTPDKWDGKSRKMLVWDDDTINLKHDIVIGYSTMNNVLGAKKNDTIWLCEGNRYVTHCADIVEQTYTVNNLYKCTYITDNAIGIPVEVTGIFKYDGQNFICENDTLMVRSKRELCTISPYIPRIATHMELLEWLSTGRRFIRYRIDDTKPWNISNTYPVLDDIKNNPCNYGVQLEVKYISDTEWHVPDIHYMDME